MLAWSGNWCCGYYQKQWRNYHLHVLSSSRINQFPGKTCRISSQHSLLLYKPYNTVIESLPHFTKAAGHRPEGLRTRARLSWQLESSIQHQHTCLYIHISAPHSGFFHANSLWLVYLSKAKIKFHIGLFCWGQSSDYWPHCFISEASLTARKKKCSGLFSL